MTKPAIRNIIFDLGDVILNINIPLTIRAFGDLTGMPEEDLLRLFNENEVFRRFETGSLSAAGFRDFVRQLLQRPEWTDDVIDTAWNALLLDVPLERIHLLKKLSANYRLFLLSNTSCIHIDRVNRILQETSGDALADLFEKAFYSYELGKMKPDPEIYLDVLRQAGLEAEETLFLDDNLLNTEAAGKLGIQTIHVQKPATILEYLQPYVT